MCLTDDFIIQKVKEVMNKMAAWDLIPAKEKGQEDEIDSRRKLGARGHILLECCHHRWEG